MSLSLRYFGPSRAKTKRRPTRFPFGQLPLNRLRGLYLKLDNISSHALSFNELGWGQSQCTADWKCKRRCRKSNLSQSPGAETP